MMFQPTSGRRGFGYVEESTDDKGKLKLKKMMKQTKFILMSINIVVESSNLQGSNPTTTNNTSQEVNDNKKKRNIFQQIIDTIKK